MSSFLLVSITEAWSPKSALGIVRAVAAAGSHTARCPMDSSGHCPHNTGPHFLPRPIAVTSNQVFLNLEIIGSS